MRIAALQMVSTSSIEQNLSAAARLIASAAEAGATLVVLPEVFATLEGLSPLADVGERMREADAFQKAQCTKLKISLEYSIHIFCATQTRV